MLRLVPLNDHSSKRSAHERGQADTDTVLDAISRSGREVGLHEAPGSGGEIRTCELRRREGITGLHVQV